MSCPKCGTKEYDSLESSENHVACKNCKNVYDLEGSRITFHFIKCPRCCSDKVALNLSPGDKRDGSSYLCKSCGENFIHGGRKKYLGTPIEFRVNDEEEGKRDHFYPSFELLEKCMLERVAKVMTAGAKKYGEYNWRKFNPEQVKDIPRHAFMHMVQYMEGDKTEDHLANCICNCMMMMWYEENDKNRLLP